MNTDPKLELPKKILQLTKHQPTDESLSILRNYTTELENVLHLKEENLEELNSVKAKKELDIKFVECLIAGKDEELLNVKQLQENDSQVEKEWSDRVKRTRKNNITSIEEYQSKMVEYREKLLSSTGFNEEAVNEQIKEIEHGKTNLTNEIESMEKDLTEAQNILLDCKSSIEQRINIIEILTEHHRGESDCEAQIAKFENELRSTMAEIEQIKLTVE